LPRHGEYRQETFGADLRIFSAEAEKSLPLYNAIVGKRRGHVVFIPGQPASGRTDTLHAIASALSKAIPRPLIIGGEIEGDVFHPWLGSWYEGAPVGKVSAVLGENLSLVAKVVPSTMGATFLDSIGQLLQSIGASWDLGKWLSGVSLVEFAENFVDYLREVNAGGPVACFIDNLDEAEGIYWTTLLLEIADLMDKDLPVFLFTTLEGPIHLGHEGK